MLGRIKNAKPEEEITVTAGTETKEVLPSSGKTIKKATVNPTPSQAKSVTPSASQKTVTPDSGKLLSQVTVAGDSDLVAGNIKKGVDIFGVTGTLKPSAPNGTSWTSINGITKPMKGLVKIGEYYVVYENSVSVDYYAYSKDGFNWTQQQTPARLSGTRVVNGYLYGFHSDNNSLKIYRNSNGSNWSEVGSITTDGFSFDRDTDFFKYANNIYVFALTNDTNIRLYYSLDGALFTLSKTITNANNTARFCLAYGNGRWVFKAPFSAVYYSLDGKTWTTGNITAAQIDNYSKTYISLTEGVWNLWAYDNLYYSNDGVTWYKVALNTGNIKSSTMECYKGLRILLAANGIYYSLDGKTWTLSNITNSASSYEYNKIEIDGKIIISNYISTNGKEWTQLPYAIKDCLRFRERYVALSSNHVVYSNDLENWTILLNYHSDTILWLCNGNLILKAYAKNAKYSVDAINWIDIPNSANAPTMLVNLENGLMVSNMGKLSYSEVWQA